MNHNYLQEIENLKQRAIQSDDVDAQIALARKYALGLSVEKDLNEAGYWYYLARRIRHISSDNIFAEEPEYDKACKELSSIRQLIESEPLIIHGDTLIRCHSKERSITIPTDIKIISKYAFDWEHSVEEVILPAGITEIQEFSFHHKVRRVIIPYGVKKLGRGAFSSDEIEELVLPEGILEIPSCAFGWGLRSITIPSSVTKIGNQAFDQCTKLRTINYQGSKNQWKEIEIGKYNTILRFAKKNYNYSYRGLVGQKKPEIALPNTPQEKTLVELFDEAVAQSIEDEAIIYGSDLLREGELIHVMLGFKKLTNKGFSQSRELYVNLVYRLSYAQRRSQSYVAWKMTLNELHSAVATIGVVDSETMKTVEPKLRGELMCWNAIAKTQTTEGETAAEQYLSVAQKLLGELTTNVANDPDTQECIAFVNQLGITLTSSPKPTVPRNLPVKPGISQTLTNCLRCGAALSGKKCNMCNLDHTKAPVRILVKVDSRDLQISE